MVASCFAPCVVNVPPLTSTLSESQGPAAVAGAGGAELEGAGAARAAELAALGPGLAAAGELGPGLGCAVGALEPGVGASGAWLPGWAEAQPASKQLNGNRA
jgi:hypothetical protein